MRFRLFRSRAFWFGVPGLVFLVWGWWLSIGHFSAAGFGGVRAWWIGQMGGELHAVWNSEDGPEWGDFQAEHEEMKGMEGPQVKDFWAAMSAANPSFRYVLIPYHWPVLGYVAGWAGLIFWRSRKYQAEVDPG